MAGTTITIEAACPACRTGTLITVDTTAYEAWIGGELLQNAFPELSLSDREAIKTGYCATCWDALWDEDPDNDDDLDDQVTDRLVTQ